MRCRKSLQPGMSRTPPSGNCQVADGSGERPPARSVGSMLSKTYFWQVDRISPRHRRKDHIELHARVSRSRAMHRDNTDCLRKGLSKSSLHRMNCPRQQSGHLDTRGRRPTTPVSPRLSKTSAFRSFEAAMYSGQGTRITFNPPPWRYLRRCLWLVSARPWRLQALWPPGSDLVIAITYSH
jgi:hypothetical protein